MGFWVAQYQAQATMMDRWTCYHDGQMHIATWALEYFKKSSSLNKVTAASRNATWNCIIQRGRNIAEFIWESFWGPKVSWDGTERPWKRVLWSDESTFQLVFGKTDVGFYVPKMKIPSRLLPTKNAKNSLCDGMGVHQCPRHGWSAYTWSTIGVGILERHMLLSRQPLFPGTPCLFQQDNARPHSAGITTAWLHRHRLCVLDWSACNPDPVSVCRIMKRRIRQQRPRTVEQLKSAQQEWAKNCACQTATIDIFNSQTITKCN